MKVIGRLGGIAVIREVVEEFVPERLPPIQDVINLVRTTYQFASFPVFGAGAQLNGPWPFAGGRFTDGDQTFSIVQLVMFPDGDLVATTSTSDSDLVLGHLCDLLDTNFGYRLRSSTLRRSYLSNVVVEFDRALSQYIDKLNRIEEAINRAGASSNLPFKGLTFGRDMAAQPQDNLVRVELTDFSIERRVGQSPNRYFCIAPMRTEEHIRVLEQIEAISAEGVIPIIGARPH